MIKLTDILKEIEGGAIGNKQAVLKMLQSRIGSTYAASAEGKFLAKIKKDVDRLDGQELIDYLTNSRRDATAKRNWGKAYFLAKLEDISLGKI